MKSLQCTVSGAPRWTVASSRTAVPLLCFCFFSCLAPGQLAAQEFTDARSLVEAAMEQGVPIPAIALSLLMRYRSRQEDTFAGRVVAAIRTMIGNREILKQELTALPGLLKVESISVRVIIQNCSLLPTG